MSGGLPALPNTLTEFFSTTGHTLRVYDVGPSSGALEGLSLRRFRAHPPSLTPLPLRRKAWLGILFWARGGRRDPMIWFLNFPLR